MLFTPRTESEKLLAFCKIPPKHTKQDKNLCCFSFARFYKLKNKEEKKIFLWLLVLRFSR
jgi:hypothetical protein